MAAVVELDGTSLAPGQVAAVAREGATVSLDVEARARNHRAHAAVAGIVRRRDVYGRTTGVGANADDVVRGPGSHGYGMRLLRSHAGGAGGVLPADVARGLLTVRLNQLLRGGAGVDARILDACAEALNRGLAPVVRDLGSLGTGDVTVLAEAGLAIAGEGAWTGPGAPPAPITFGNDDALAFMSSNARTIAQAALTCMDATTLLASAEAAAACSFAAIRGNAESLDPRVQAARPHPGQVAAAQRLRDLVGDTDPARRLQDPLSFRCLPQVHGLLVDALGRLGQVLAVELNAAAENPLVLPGDDDVLHNGNFHGGHLAQALDQLRSTLVQVATLAAERLRSLLDPTLTDLPAFLAADEPGSSGLMILEYTAHSALAELRAKAAPAATSSVVVARGLENHGSFAPLAAAHASEAVGICRVVVAAELLAAARALAMADRRAGSEACRQLVAAVERGVARHHRDRALSGDLDLAQELVRAGPSGW